MTTVQDDVWPCGPPALPGLSVGSVETVFDDGAAATAQFREFDAVHFARLLDPALLALVTGLAAASEFELFGNDMAVQELEASPQRAGRVLNLALSRAPFLRWVEGVTGCGTLDRVEGRVMQTRLRPGDRLDWHDDLIAGEGRRLALVIALGPEEFAGGEFQLRRKNGERVFEHRYNTPGAALLFRIGAELEHCVLPLTAGGPRRVYAGWAFAR